MSFLRRSCDGWLPEVRAAWRFLAAKPGWTGVVVISMALGIGANSVVYSLVESVLLEPLPYRDPERVVLVRDGRADGGVQPLRGRDLARWREDALFIDLAPYGEPVVQAGETGGIRIVFVGSDVFELLGVRPLIGVGLETQDADQSRAMLSYGYWQGQFAGDPTVIGQSVTIFGLPSVIAGVMPRGFFFPDTRVDLWVSAPWSIDVLYQRDQPTYWAVGRLRPGVTLGQAQADIDAISQRVSDQTGEAPAAKLLPAHDALVGDYRLILWMLSGAVGLVLLLACVNVANLMLTRGSARREELALRAALGAGRLMLFRQLITESIMLSAIAGGGGAILATWSVGLVRALGLIDIPRIENAALNGSVLAFTVTISLVAGILAGLVPAWRMSCVEPIAFLREGGSASPRLGARRLRDALVAGQVAAALVLVVVAGLFVRSSMVLARVDWGFDTERVGVLRVASVSSRNPAAVAELVDALGAIPGVQASAAAVSVPLMESGLVTRELVVRDGQTVDSGVRAAGYLAMPAYFAALGTSMRGREFSSRDDAGAPRVVILSESLAARLFPDADPIGEMIHLATVPMERREFSDLRRQAQLGTAGLDVMQVYPDVPDVARYATSASTGRRVVGVAADVRMSGGLGSGGELALWVPYLQAVSPLRPVGETLRNPDFVPQDLAAFVHESLSSGGVAALNKFVIRTDSSELRQTLETARRRLLEADPAIRFQATTALGELVSRSTGATGSNTLMLSLSAAFGMLSLILAAVGVYGMISHTVGQKIPEIGIRMALGAERFAILRMILAHGFVLAGVGLALGLAGAWASTHVLGAFLYGVSPLDGTAFLAGSVVTISVTIAATLGPALRASRVDPLTAIRHV